MDGDSANFKIREEWERSMPNRARPRCPDCNTAMGPLFRHGARGQAFVRVPDAFHCREHDRIARGRKKTIFLP
jgi:hypothetical protein